MRRTVKGSMGTPMVGNPRQKGKKFRRSSEVLARLDVEVVVAGIVLLGMVLTSSLISLITKKALI